MGYRRPRKILEEEALDAQVVQAQGLLAVRRWLELVVASESFYFFHTLPWRVYGRSFGTLRKLQLLCFSSQF